MFFLGFLGFYFSGNLLESQLKNCLVANGKTILLGLRLCLDDISGNVREFFNAVRMNY